MAVLKGLSIAGRIGKSVGYVVFAINSIISLCTRSSKNLYNRVIDKDVFNVIIHVDGGVEISTHENLSKSDVDKIVNALSVMENITVSVSKAES